MNHRMTLISRHRRIGLAALVAFVLFYLAGFAFEITYPDALQRIFLLHIPLLVICGSARLRGIWIHQKMGQVSNRSKLKWWAIILFIGVCFTTVCVGMVLMQSSEVNLVHLGSEISIYEMFLLVHIGLAFLLIFIGRTGLIIEKRSSTQKLLSI